MRYLALVLLLGILAILIEYERIESLQDDAYAASLAFWCHTENLTQAGQDLYKDLEDKGIVAHGLVPFTRAYALADKDITREIRKAPLGITRQCQMLYNE